MGLDLAVKQNDKTILNLPSRYFPTLRSKNKNSFPPCFFDVPEILILILRHIKFAFIDYYANLSHMKSKTCLSKITPAIAYFGGKPVILDADLARIYGVSTKALNQAVRRNKNRFPADFMFRLSRKESVDNRSQFVTGPRKHRDPRFRPFAFTEQGAIMAANVLNSVTAVRMSVFVVRAFVKMRAMLSSNRNLASELKKLEKKLTGRLDAHEIAIVDILRRLIKLLEPPAEPSLPEKPPIGFQP